MASFGGWLKPFLSKFIRTKIGSYVMRAGIITIVPRTRIGVVVVAITDDNRILMLRHAYRHKAEWGLPGGWLNRNEDPVSGVIRELEEETGLKIARGPIIYSEFGRNPKHIVMAMYTPLEPAPVTLSHEIYEAKWLRRDELTMPLLRQTVEAIDAALAHKATLRTGKPS